MVPGWRLIISPTTGIIGACTLRMRCEMRNVIELGRRFRDALPFGSRLNEALQDRRRAALPLCPALRLDRLDRLHVGAGLRQHVVEVVADADEGEALVEELGDPGGAE